MNFEKMVKMITEMVDDIVTNGRALEQNTGKQHMDVTPDGVAAVSADGRLITFWTSADFDSNIKK